MKEFFLKRYIFIFFVIVALVSTSSPGAGTVEASIGTRIASTRRPAKSPTEQTGKQKTPATTQGPLAETVNLVNKTLGNGLEVIVLEDHSEPLVTVELAVRN